MDAAIRAAVFNAPSHTRGDIQVQSLTSTYSTHTDGSAPGSMYRWHYVLAADLPTALTLTYADLPGASTAAFTPTSYTIVDWFNPLGAATGAILDQTHNWTVPTGQGQPGAPANALPIRYFLLAPKLPGGWTLLGETAKFAPMSAQRLSSFTTLAAGDGFTVVVTAANSGAEAVPAIVHVVAPGATIVTAASCSFATSASVTLRCSTQNGGCTCA